MPRVMPGYKAHARQRIIRQAEQVFSEKGYHQATMKEIARAVGVSKAALYQYFSNKEDLLLAVLERMTEERKTQILDILDDSNVAAIATEEFFDEFLKRSKTGGILGFDLLYEMSRNEDLRGKIREEYDNGFDRIVSFLTGLKKRGIVQKDTISRQIAIGIIGLRDGLLSMSTLGIEEKLLKKTWQTWMIVLLQSILAHK